MATTTDFDAWLGANGPETEDEKEELLESVRDVSEAGNYATTVKDSKWFVKGWGDDTLLLASEAARNAFIKTVEVLDMPDDLEEGFQRNINNPHA